MTNVNVNDSMKLAELLKTPICKMDGEELAFLITSITSGNQVQLSQPKREEHNVYGIAGIAQIFGWSKWLMHSMTYLFLSMILSHSGISLFFMLFLIPVTRCTPSAKSASNRLGEMYPPVSKEFPVDSLAKHSPYLRIPVIHVGLDF